MFGLPLSCGPLDDLLVLFGLFAPSTAEAILVFT